MALPIVQHRQRNIEAISTHNVVIIQGGADRDKRIHVPQYILDSGGTEQCYVAVAQPRLVVARSLAQCVADERSAPFW